MTALMAILHSTTILIITVLISVTASIVFRFGALGTSILTIIVSLSLHYLWMK